MALELLKKSGAILFERGNADKEESKQAMTPPQPTPAGTFRAKIENTTYVVGVPFS